MQQGTVHQKKEHVRITLDTTKLVHGYYKLQTDVQQISQVLPAGLLPGLKLV